MLGLIFFFGSIIGFSLGLTGGGGGILAVPLLVYGLSIAPREAVGVSLASVGGIALLGVVPKFWQGEVEWRTGLVFAVAGMAGAPVGNYTSSLLPESVLLIAFSILMLFVARRMWSHSRKSQDVADDSSQTTERGSSEGVACGRDVHGRIHLSPHCFGMLSLLGFGTGILSGLFGVGGGFIVVPALVLFSGMKIHQAVATSLLVIALVSVSGVSSYLLSGGSLSTHLTLLFVAGGLVGIRVGQRLSARLSGAKLQRVFSVAIVAVALFVIAKSLSSSA